MFFVKEMENDFYRDEFEQMLRDTTEDFRMYPSRKVWHSIYNDLHPDRKWPSFAACLLLLTAILYIGVSNNNYISRTTQPLISSNPSFSLQATWPVSKQMTVATNHEIEMVASTAQESKQPYLSGIKEGVPGKYLSYNQLAIKILATSTTGETVVANDLSNSSIGIASKPAELDKETFTSLEKTFERSTIPVVNDIITLSKDEQNGVATNRKVGDADGKEWDKLASSISSELPITPKIELTASQQESGRSLSFTEKAWIEDFAFHNLRNAGKWKTNLSFQYYITPSIGYRHLNKNNDFEPVNGALIRTNDNDEVTQQPAPNFEAGAVMILGINKRLKIKSGLQFNLTNYNTYAHGLQHPTQTTVPMNDPRSGYLRHEYYNTTYGNALGSNLTKLNNQTLQLSLPIGIDYRVAGNDKIKWYMGAGIQASKIMSGKAYLISSDNKNFVQDDAMLRKWNASVNVETFVSIKTPSGIDINVGPQLRYQLLSTYNKRYSYTEKLYNVGIKIGITRKL